MSKVKSKNTGIERILIDELHKRKISNFSRYPNIIGKPDIIFENSKVAIFCDGDFWHGYNFKLWKTKLNSFWFKKISNNIKRDKTVSKELRANGWKVIRFWGHQIKNNPAYCIKKIEEVIIG
jgi:DNA mismatch endonuclease Vsr